MPRVSAYTQLFCLQEALDSSWIRPSVWDLAADLDTTHTHTFRIFFIGNLSDTLGVYSPSLFWVMMWLYHKCFKKKYSFKFFLAWWKVTENTPSDFWTLFRNFWLWLMLVWFQGQRRMILYVCFTSLRRLFIKDLDRENSGLPKGLRTLFLKSLF